MKKILLQFAAILLCVALCIPSVFAARARVNYVRVGLAYESGSLASANLQNNTGYGEGYRFGYFDDDLEFVELGYTDETVSVITMLRASEMYLKGGAYSASQPSGSYETIGCYHVVLDYCRSFEDALEEAEQYREGFVAWINGEYQVRAGAYSTLAQAQEAMYELGGQEVKGTSAYAVNVVETGSAQIIFQFDGGSGLALGVMPDVTGAEDVRTWFKDYRYHGGFRYERIGGGNLTVVNIVDMETYVKGVIPYEMANNWPLEALKAQAVCARSYAYNNVLNQKHSANHFDVCATIDCQVYHGQGSNVNATAYQANERTDQAVDETAGMYGLYNGVPIEAFYASSHGGASERIDNVWNSSFAKYPYLCGVIDPYEQLAASRNSYSYWTKSYTAAQLTQRLQARGMGMGTTVSSLELTYSELGNVIQVRVIYANGKSNTFTPKMDWGVMSLFGISSLHFTINGQGASSGTKPPAAVQADGTVVVNERETLDTDGRVYAISGNGTTTRIDPEDVYVISGSGSVDELDASGTSSGGKGSGGSAGTPTNTVVTITGNTFVVEGSGNGHQLGMSQYGAYAMVGEGFTYDEIVEFYYPGVTVGRY